MTSNATLRLATRTKVFVFKSALLETAEPEPRVTASTNVRPLTLDEIRSAAAAYHAPTPGRESLPSAEAIDVTGAPDVFVAAPAKAMSPLSPMRLPATRPTHRSVSSQVVLGLAVFGGLVALGSLGIAVRMHLGGVDRSAAAYVISARAVVPAAAVELPAIRPLPQPAVVEAPPDVAPPDVAPVSAPPEEHADPSPRPERTRPRRGLREGLEDGEPMARPVAVAPPRASAPSAPPPVAPPPNKELDDALRAASAANKALESSLH